MVRAQPPAQAWGCQDDLRPAGLGCRDKRSRYTTSVPTVSIVNSGTGWPGCGPPDRCLGPC